MKISLLKEKKKDKNMTGQFIWQIIKYGDRR